MDFKKTIRMFPAYDKRADDPTRNYGICCVRMLFVMQGEKGATSWSCHSGMYLPQQVVEHGNDPWKRWQPMPGGVYYCSPIKRHDHQTGRDDCEWLDGKTCYGDGSMLAGDDVMKALLEEGSEGVWKKLEEFYNSWLVEND